MRHLSDTRARHHLAAMWTTGRWALPAAALLAVSTMGAAHGTQPPSDHAAEFDPGSVCSGSVVAGPTSGHHARLSQLVISAHAASLRAAR